MREGIYKGIKIEWDSRIRDGGIFLAGALAGLMCFGCGQSGGVDLAVAKEAEVKELVPEALRIAREGLEDTDPQVRAQAVEVVADTRQVTLMPKVVRLLKDEYVPVRFLAALAVGDLEYRLGEGEIEDLLGDRDQNVQIAAVYAMNKFRPDYGTERIRKALGSEDQTVKANAALLLGKAGDKESLKFLYWVLRHKDSEDKVRFQAAEAIARLGDKRIYPKLWSMLISAYADDRVVGIRAMGALGTDEARNALITMLDDDILEVRLAAAGELGALGEKTGEAEVLDVFKGRAPMGTSGQDLERVYVLSALAIGRIQTPPLRKFLPSLLENDSKMVRIAAAKAVLQWAGGK
jgi:HEAT repeat protein